MQIEIHGDAVAAAEITALIESWDQALRERDPAGLTAVYADDVRVFDIGAQLQDSAAYGEQWRACLPWFGNEAWIERRGMQLYAGTEFAFLHGFTRVGGERSPAPADTPWIRVTVGYRKVDGAWRVEHEHASMPIDFEAGKPVPIFGDPI
ncbi:MAG: nuclear transport factor 2 family protein [Gammaproteobacteria bacterium]|nr:nuclear transport factor 2 family protein [Gammaproteobacteria bacterium]